MSIALGIGRQRHGNRTTVRASNGHVYSVLDNESNNVQMWKGNNTSDPTSFSEQDAGNAPDFTDLIKVCCAIDSSDIIHVFYAFDDSASHGASPTYLHQTFDTSTDLWGGDEETVVAIVRAGATTISAEWNICAMIDTNDDLHFSFIDKITNMGTNRDTVFYINKIGGSWNTKVQIAQAGDGTSVYSGGDLIIGKPTDAIAECPIITVMLGVTVFQVDMYHGNGVLNPTSFIEETDVSGSIVMASTTERTTGSTIIDSNGKITVVVQEDTTNDIYVLEHLPANNWATWETPVSVNSGNWRNVRIGASGTDRYVIARDVSISDLKIFESLDGASWTDEGFVNVGTFQQPQIKWSQYNNNPPSTGNFLDYTMVNGSPFRIEYDNFSIPVIAVAKVPFPQIHNSSVMM